jgi:hypothetical protein
MKVPITQAGQDVAIATIAAFKQDAGGRIVQPPHVALGGPLAKR